MFVKGLSIAAPRTTAGEILIVVNGDINPSALLQHQKKNDISTAMLSYAG